MSAETNGSEIEDPEPAASVPSPDEEEETEQIAYFFPYMGGGRWALASWQAQLDHIELRHLDYLSLAKDAGQKDLISAREMVLLLTKRILADNPSSFSFVGHSMGSIYAFEVARELAARGGPSPKVLVVSACPPPASFGQHSSFFGSGQSKYTQLEAFISALNVIDPLFSKLPSYDRLIKSIKETVSFEGPTIESYVFEPGDSLPCPIVSYIGTKDVWIGPKEMRDWAKYTSADFSLRELPGDHFFYRETLGFWDDLSNALRCR